MTHTDADKLRDLAYLLLEGAGALEELRELREERDHWKAEHTKLLNSSISHGNAMMGHVLKAALNGNLTTSKEHKRSSRGGSVSKAEDELSKGCSRVEEKS